MNVCMTEVEKVLDSDGKGQTKYAHKTKDRVTQTALKTGGELRCSERVSSSYLNNTEKYLFR
jgi:hypothetical protein